MAPSTSSPTLPITICRAQRHDVGLLTDLLARSFHHSTGWLGWLYPLLRAGIYEDLSHRLRHPGRHYVCLVALGTRSGENGGQRSPTSSPSRERSPCRLHDLRSSMERDIRDIGSHSGRSSGPSVAVSPIVGTVEMTAKTPFPLGLGSPTYLYVSNLAIDQDHRRQGIATALLEECDRLARQWGFSATYLHVLENNQGARRLYRSVGYETEAVLGNWFTQTLGRSRRLLMRKTLPRRY